MPGAGAGDAHIHRVANLARDAIVASTDRLVVAGGKAVVTILDVPGIPRIELTSTALVLPTMADGTGAPAPRRLPDEIRQLGDDVRRALIAQHVLVKSVRQIEIEIHLRGARPTVEIIYRCNLR